MLNLQNCFILDYVCTDRVAQIDRILDLGDLIAGYGLDSGYCI